MRTVFSELIDEVASSFGLIPAYVAAFVDVESSTNVWAWNPEPRYRWIWDVQSRRPFRSLTAEEASSKTPPADFYDMRGFHGADADQEWWGQQASWGLMQVMGAVARERGFAGIYLPALCDPRTNLMYGCDVVASNLRWANGDVAKAAAAYNGGRGGWMNQAPQSYARKILSAYNA